MKFGSSFRKILLISIVLIIRNLSGGQIKPVLDYVNTLKNDKDLRGAIISVKVTDEFGNASLKYNSDILLMPASIQKIVTTGTALMILGKDYRYSTTLAYDGFVGYDSILNGNIYIIGYGDPTLGSDRFAGTLPDHIFGFFADALSKTGIKTINGKIIPVSDYFKDGYDTEPLAHRTWECEDTGSYYGVGASSLNFCENKFDMTLYRSPENTDFYCDYPFKKYDKVRLDIIDSDKNDDSDLSIYVNPFDSVYFIKGRLSVSDKDKILECALLNPQEACAESFADFLHYAGFSVKSNNIPQKTPTVIAEHKSPTYSEIAMITNSHSNNLFADAAFKTVGKMTAGKAQYEDAAKAITEILKKSGMDVTNINVADGSGLSRRNSVTADFLCEYLRFIKTHIPDFDKYLPAPGDRGTMKNFMSSYSCKSKVRMKSGTLTGAIGYAGYVKDKRNRTQYVAVMVNNYTCKASTVRKKLEQLIHLISEI